MKVLVSASCSFEKEIEIPDEMYDRFIETKDTDEDYDYIYNEIETLLPKGFELHGLNCLEDENLNEYLAEW